MHACSRKAACGTGPKVCHACVHACVQQEGGARQRRDALGGDFFASLLVELRSKLPLPPLANAGVYGRAFLNGGSSMLLTGQPDVLVPGPRNALAELAATSRWSVVRTCAPVLTPALHTPVLALSHMYICRHCC